MIRNELQKLRASVRGVSGLDLAAYAILVFMVLLLLGGTVYIFFPIDLALKHWLFGLGLLIVVILAISIYRRRNPPDNESKLLEENGNPEENRQTTQQRIIPPKPMEPPRIAIESESLAQLAATNVSTEISSNPPPRRHLRRRRVFRELVNEKDTNFLVIHTYSPVPQGRFKKKLWKHKTHKIELDNSPHVDIRLATKIPILPTDAEAKIYCLERLHWWSHGPAQIGIIVAILAALALVVPSILLSGDTVAAWIPALALTIVGGVWYFFVWIKWAYTYLIFTNRKVRLPYRPPFNLPSETPSTDLTKLTGGTQPKAGWWGRTVGYGTIRTETVADVVDRWLLDKVRYIKRYEEKAQLLDQLREDAERIK